MVRESLVYKSMIVASTTVAVEAMCRELLQDVRCQGFSDDELFGIHLAMEEAFLNAVKHGNKEDASKRVQVKCVIGPEEFDISIADEGEGFDPQGVPDPRSEENLYRSSGRGVLLMRAYMDSVEYNKQGNCVRMKKFRSRESDASAKQT